MLVETINKVNVYTLEDGEEQVCKYTGEVMVAGDKCVRVCADSWNDDDEYMSYDYFNANEDDFEACEDCGDMINITEDRNFLETVNGGYVCRHCFEWNNWYTCADCGEAVPCDEAVQIHECAWPWGDFYVCQDCANENYYQCDDCGEWFDSELNETHYDTHVCNNCLDERYITCADCGDLFRPEDGCWDEYGDEWYCDNCYPEHEGSNEIIGDYHDHHGDVTFYNEDGEIEQPWNRKGNDRYCSGWELEVENRGSDWNDRVNMAEEIIELMDNHVYCEKDGSLNNGFEIISMPHTVEAFKKLPLKEMLERLVSNGYVSHMSPRCGLHIHVSKEFFGDTAEEQDENTTKVVHLYAKEYEFFFKCSRRTRDSANCWASKTDCENFEDAKSQKRWANGHGVAVNLQNMRGMGTVEFRLGRGTLKYESFLAWYDMHIAIARNAKNIEPDDTDLNKWLAGITDETKAYILARTGREVA